jgi:cyclic-di-GMP phosphodiesterase, flagellum assembly factor TipF
MLTMRVPCYWRANQWFQTDHAVPMLVVNHLLILASYLLVAGFAGFVLTGAPADLGVQIGVLVLAVGIAVHLTIARTGSYRAVTQRMARLRGAQVKLGEELQNLRTELRATAGGERDDRSAELLRVTAELRVLQTAVEQIAARASEPETRAFAEPMPEPAPPTIEPPRMNGSNRVLSGLSEAETLAIVQGALSANRVELYAQPIVSLPQRKRRHFECLSRIRADDHSIMVPGDYVNVAERAGLIAGVDNMLLYRCVQLVRRVQRQNQNVGLFVNISGHTLADVRFFREFISFMAANRELAPGLIFEFAQAHVANHGAKLRSDLEQLARLGFRFSMDQITNLDLDLDELGRRHFRFIKIDAQRLLDSTRGADARFDMKRFKAALDRNGIDLVVERIETEETLVELLDFNIDLGQGFLFGEPRPARED